MMWTYCRIFSILLFKLKCYWIIHLCFIFWRKFTRTNVEVLWVCDENWTYHCMYARWNLTACWKMETEIIWRTVWPICRRRKTPMTNCKLSYCNVQFLWTTAALDTCLPAPRMDLWPLGVATCAILWTRGKAWKDIWMLSGMTTTCSSTIIPVRIFPKWKSVRMCFIERNIELLWLFDYNRSHFRPVMADFSRGQPLPPGVEDETAAGACQILKTLETYEHPLIGLEFLLELHSTDESKEPRYFCLLCSKRGDSRIILVHLTSQKHYLLYLVR